MSYYMNMSYFNEGEQADAYQWRKYKDKKDEEENERKRLDRRHSGGVGSGRKKDNTETTIGRAVDAVDKVTNREDMWDAYRPDHKDHDKYRNAYDAANRHMRRHPKQYQECGIFSEVTFLNEI